MYKDTRLGGVEKWYHKPPKDAYMRIPDELLNNVCFICVKVQGGKNAGEYQAFGTAFFVVVDEDNWAFSYLATAKHLLDEARRLGYTTLYARINKIDGSSAHVNLGAIDNWIHINEEKNGTDLAMLAIVPDHEVFDYTQIPTNMMLTRKEIEYRNIGAGDELFVTGLFTLQTGKIRNIPIVRTGIISAMPQEPLVTKKGQKYFAFLAEMRSIGGLSGSPVFVHLSRHRVYNSKIEDGADWRFFLLGLVRGHWELKRDFTTDTDLQENDVHLGFNKGENLNVGIAIVTPAEYLLEMLMNPKIVEMRKREIEAENEIHGQITEDALLEVGANKTPTFTKDLFENALKKTSRKISLPEKEKKETSE